MSDLDLKEFSENNNLNRYDIAKVLDSSIHSVNSWFSGSRNLPKAKEKLLLAYVKKDNVPIQSINTNNVDDIIKDKDKIIELLERNEKKQNEINELKEMLTSITKAVNINSIMLDEIKEYWHDYFKTKSTL